MDDIKQQRLRKQIKTEADEFLFKDLQFDDRLKERVRSGVQVEPKGSAPSIRTRTRKKRWGYVVAVSASAILLLLAVPSIIGDDEMNPSEPPAQILNVPVGTEGTETGTDMGVLLDPTIVNNETKSVKEVLSLFGSELQLPAYTPDDYELQQEALAVENEEGQLTKAQFQYEADERTFMYIAERAADLNNYEQLEEIMINGNRGYVDALGESYTAIYWKVEDILYTVNGEISREEAVSVAESVPNM